MYVSCVDVFKVRRIAANQHIVGVQSDIIVPAFTRLCCTNVCVYMAQSDCASITLFGAASLWLTSTLARRCLEGLFDSWGVFGQGFNNNLTLGGPTPIGARKANLSQEVASHLAEVALNEQV